MPPSLLPKAGHQGPLKIHFHVCGSLLMSEGGTWATFLSQENPTVWPGEHQGRGALSWSMAGRGPAEEAEQSQPTASCQAPGSVLF